MGNNYTMVAKTLFGFEELLEEELRNLGAINVQKGVRSVTFEGDKGFMYKANLCLRTAIKILKPVKSFRVRNEQDLYDQIYKMDWERFMSVHSTFAIDATLATDRFHHSQFISLKTKDAIVDKFRNLHGTRPDVDLKYPDIRIHIHIQQSEVTGYLL